MSTELTREAWNQFLRALAPEPSEAGSRYEQLRTGLIALYRWRELPWPEDLADQALDHAACQLGLGAGLRADLGVYLQGIAHRIGDEARQRRRAQAIDAATLPDALRADPDDPLPRLCRCLDDLPRRDRKTLLEYETGTGYERVRRRKALAAELGIPTNALRVRVHRLRARLLAMMGDDPAAQRAASAPHAVAARRRRAAAPPVVVADPQPLRLSDAA